MGAQCLKDPKSIMMVRRYHFRTISVLVASGRTVLYWSVGKVVPFYEIVINPRDLKHVVELLRCRGELVVVITTRKHL